MKIRQVILIGLGCLYRSEVLCYGRKRVLKAAGPSETEELLKLFTVVLEF